MDWIAFDTETYAIEPGCLAPQVVCVSFCYPGAQPWVELGDDGVLTLTRLLDNGYKIVCHHVAYDMACLSASYPWFFERAWLAYRQGQVACTLTRELLRKIALGWMDYCPTTKRKNPEFSLAALVFEYFGEHVAGKDSDSWRTQYRWLDQVPLSEWPEDALQYAALDAQYHARLYQAQTEDTGHETFPDEVAQTFHAFTLHLMSCYGMRTDPKAVAELRKRIEFDVFDDIQALKEVGLLRADGSKDTKKIQSIVLSCLGLETPLTDKKKEPCIDAETLESTKHPALVRLARISNDQKLLSTYVPLLEKGTSGPIHPRYSVLVASGRTSCSHPNIQNQTRKGGVRECWIPRPGNLFVFCDYSMAELRSLAQVLLDIVGWSDMATALQEGRELHIETAAEILGIDYSEALSRFEQGDKDVADARQLAKAANFGFPGGLGPDTFVNYAHKSWGVEITVDQARELRSAWFRRYPEMRIYFQTIQHMLEQSDGKMRIEQIRSGRVRGNVGFCDGCNSFFQGLTADGAKAALTAVSQECYGATQDRTALYSARPVAFIHDEIILECATDKVHDVALRLQGVMIQEMQKFLPDIPVLADIACATRWYKGAKAKYDTEGRMTPWEPKK